MDINGIINMSENNKVVIFDFAQNVTKDSIEEISIQFKLDEAYSPEDNQKILELLYKNDFRINSYHVINKVDDSYSIIDDDIIMSQHEDLPAIITFSIESCDFDDVNNFSVYIYINGLAYRLYFLNEPNKQFKTYDNIATTIGGNTESFMLLRTNPKLTGNIKLVVSEDKLYLDTFKVSQTSILNDKKYRHKSISADGNYPHDVYSVFKDVPQGELYSVYEDSYDPHKHYYNMDLQIENIYEYGAEYNSDNLYSENMKILAPLYIGKHLPTYFAIFKSDRLFTTDETATNSDIFRSLLVESQCIKIYDLRQHSAIGKYLKGYQNMITKYFAGTCQLQFIEQDYDSNDENYRQGRNTWSGIAVNKGILTDKTETTYFGTQILNSSKKTQEDYNMFVLNGYSRNMLLFPNILNLEFMFNDELADDMTMHNYFGLYLTENEFIHFNQVIKTTDKSGNYKLNYYNKDNQLININETTIDVIDNPEYADRIFFASTLNSATYLAIRDDFDLFVKNNVANKAYKNIVQVPGKLVKFDKSQKSFITLDFTKQIRYGEHFKFTATDVQYKDDKFNVTIDLIASNDIRLAKTLHNINPYVLTNNSEIASDDELDTHNKLYRITFYTQDLSDNTKQATLEEQLERMRFAIQKINSFLFVSHYDNETIGLISSQETVYFQHILADEVLSDNIEDPVRCFNYNNITAATLNSDIPDLYRAEDMPFGNSGFEIIGPRYSNITKFIKISKTTNAFYEVEDDLYDALHNVKCPLIATSNGYQPMILFKVNNGELIFNNEKFGSELSFDDITRASVTSPWNVKSCLIASPSEISSPNGFINISSPMPCSVSLMGINNIKDINMYVDINEYKNYKTGIYADFSEGEIVSTDNSDTRLRKYIPYIISYGHIKGIDSNSTNSFVITDDLLYYSTGSEVKSIELSNNTIEFDVDTRIILADTNSLDLYDYNTYLPILQEKNYYINPSDTENSKLEIPLVPLVNCQWKSNGTYFDNNSLLDISELFNYVTKGNFVQNVYTPAGTYNNQYIINSFKDYINYNGTIMTIQEFLMDHNYANSFKKFLVSSFKVDTAIASYNAYIQSLEFVYYGIKFVFKLTNAKYANEIKLNEYNNYDVYIINDYNSSETNEVYISVVEEFILIINHVYKPGQLYSNNSIQILNNDKINNAQYNWYSAAYNYQLQTSGIINETFYLNKSDFYQLYDSDNISYMLEYDLDIYDSEECNIDEKPVYAYFNTNNDYFESFTKTDVLYLHADSALELQYSFAFNNPSKLSVEYSNAAIQNMIDTYVDTIQDYRQHNTYFIKNNDNIEETTESYKDILAKFINSFTQNIKLSVITADAENKIFNISEKYQPLSLTLSIPNRIKYNQGYFNPDFVDIFTFVVNDDISDVINLDTLYANTQVSYISSLRNYYYNKILDTNKDCTYNYFRVNYRSPFTTNWDNTLYRLYSNDSTYEYIPGYQLGINDKMMFGSKVLAIHNDGIELNNWNYNDANNQVSITSSAHNDDSTTEEKLQIKLNLTKVFYNYMLSLTNFVNIWENISNQLNINIYINNYINKTLSKVYNFRNNFDVVLFELYTPELDNIDKSIDPFERFVTEKPSNFENYTKTNNIKTTFENINNEVILTLEISNYNKYKFYPIVKINKI